MRPREEVTLALAVLAPLVVLAEDTFAWDPAQRAERRVGARFVEKLEIDFRRDAVLSRDARAFDEQHDKNHAAFTLVHTIAAATSAAVTEDRIKVERWSRGSERGAADESLEGSVVTIAGEGAARTYEVEGSRTPTPHAKDWILHDLVKDGRRDPGLDELDWPFILPSERVAEGGTWKLDAAAVAREILGPRAAIDAEKSSATGKLASVKLDRGARVGRIEVAVDLSLARLGGSKVEWKAGGLLEIRYALDVSLEPARRDECSGTITMSQRGKGTVTPDRGQPFDLDIDEVTTFKLAKGPVP